MIIYRKSVKEDNETINKLFIEMIKIINQRMINEGVEPYTELEKGYQEGYLDKFYVDDSRCIFVAVDEDKEIGYLSVVKHDDYLYLDDYCVTSDYRGKGIGSGLIKTAEDYAVSEGISFVKLHVQTANHQSREFYKNKGYELISEEEKRLLLGKKVK